MGLSDQDIKAALSLVDESWERQEYRLQQYLQRNYNLANGIPATLDVGDEEFERPSTATSLGKLVEKVQIESTPTVEKDLQLGGGPMASPPPTITLQGSAELKKVSTLEKEIEMSFADNIWSRPRLPS